MVRSLSDHEKHRYKRDRNHHYWYRAWSTKLAAMTVGMFSEHLDKVLSIVGVLVWLLTPNHYSPSLSTRKIKRRRVKKWCVSAKQMKPWDQKYGSEVGQNSGQRPNLSREAKLIKTWTETLEFNYFAGTRKMRPMGCGMYWDVIIWALDAWSGEAVRWQLLQWSTNSKPSSFP